MFKRKQPVDTRRHAIAAPELNSASPETKSQQKRGSVFGNFLGLGPPLSLLVCECVSV